MPEDPSDPAVIHTYRPTLRRRMGSLALLGACALCLGAPSGLVVAPALRLLVEEPQARLIVIGGLCLTGPLWAVFLFLMVQLLLNLLGLLFGHTLKLGPEGLDSLAWPRRNVRCEWSEVERIGKYLLVYEAIYLKGGSRDRSYSRDRRSRLQGLFNPAGEDAIRLSGMEGWPDGALRDDLQRYAPHLFDPATGKPAALPSRPPAGGRSRDECLYAALSHAGALLFPVFTPLAFWLSERKKSAYVAFQAGQALVFQLVTQVVFLATLVCAAGGLLIPVGLIQLSDRFAIDGRTYGLIVLAAFGLAGLLISLALAMLWYSGLAIAQTLHGEDFRYPLIGKWIEKFFQ